MENRTYGAEIAPSSVAGGGSTGSSSPSPPGSTGVIALFRLLELGLGERAVQARVASGRLHRVHQGVYAVGRADLPIKGRWMAAVLACGDGALLSHRSAATLEELLNVRGGRIEVTIPRRTP